MALSWALAVLSLLPVLDAQSPACPNFSVPITNASLDQEGAGSLSGYPFPCWLAISGKWFYIASAYRLPQYKEEASDIHAAYFYFTPNHTEDRIHLREYLTMPTHCRYYSTNLRVNRENGTLTRHVNGHLLLPKDPKTFMLAFFPEDKQNMGLIFFADKPEVTQEQMQEFYDYLTCMGIDKSEVLYGDEKKNMCLQLEKQHEEEWRKEKENPETGSALDYHLGDFEDPY